MNKTLKYYLILVFLIMSSIFISCSGDGSKDVLSFFFDGVEEDAIEENKTENPVNAEAEVAEVAETKPQLFYHEVYKEKLCDNCHDPEKGNNLVEDQPDLCYMCHEDFSSKFEYVHYPVEAGECTGCHSPHYSNYPKLLIAEGKEVCLPCHDDPDVLENEIHISLEETPCYECHNPHGGDDSTML